ncbi:histidinol-phosphate transaminase [Candidatus Thioglobus sp. NP1]|uniref:histidinol-phosphate transaminase n=1 Tax=Candidatus Thioglobus sp. NP1 TaxID=2508687 RepID=UPI000DEDB0D8|nr:histidinol-phosphate transaminase [Candidatus Thioglobus sp. NP1]AXE62178.1 histidinol-phosphate transaminase [Candidatus Thioglobus sp. NP1]
MNACESILGLSPYQGGKPIEELERELGIKNITKLASNENPLGISKKVSDAIKDSLPNINRYPDGNAFELKKAISNKLGIKPEQISLGNGSNELLELIARVFVSKSSDEVIFSEYAFVVYPLVTQALGATAQVSPAKNFGHDLNAMLRLISSNTKLIFVANPNNPTGTLLSNEEIYSFLNRVPDHIPVVLDQAYFEYIDKGDHAISWLEEFDNLIITRTFSKAYGLAGLRVGYSICSNSISDYINRVREPFNVNHTAQIAAIAALADDEYLKESIKVNADGYKQLKIGFNLLELEYIPSSANFIAVRFNDAMQIYNDLLHEGVIVRPVEMKNYLRISIGTKQENEHLLSALSKIL